MTTMFSSLLRTIVRWSSVSHPKTLLSVCTEGRFVGMQDQCYSYLKGQSFYLVFEGSIVQLCFIPVYLLVTYDACFSACSPKNGLPKLSG